MCVNSWDITFNPTENRLVTFGENQYGKQIYINRSTLPEVDKVKYGTYGQCQPCWILPAL